MASVSERTARQQRIMAPLLVTAILLGLAGLPVAVWLDLRGLSEQMLQAAAAPSGITLSYETYALVSDGVRASPQEPIRMKGIGRAVVPYAVAADLTAGDRGETQDTVFSERARAATSTPTSRRWRRMARPGSGSACSTRWRPSSAV